MARINIVVPPFHPKNFTGGTWCIMEYAWGLMKRGHQVNLIPTAPSASPKWFDKEGLVVVNSPWSRRAAEALRSCSRFAAKGVKRLLFRTRGLGPAGQEAVSAGLLAINPAFYSMEVGFALRLMYVRRILPPADITLATSYQTALPVRLFGKGQLFYFMQHYEVVFKNESEDPYLAEMEAKASYNLGLKMIANSSWLQQRIVEGVPAAEVRLCPNAINHQVFSGTPKRRADTQEVAVISYGGRGVEWKGFREMAEAVKVAREALPGMNIHWRVYGSACLPPQNPIANYESLGFLNPPALAKAYRSADVLLSASWYESFPLFPLEAMACGLPVVTTQAGTEEYAIPSETAEVVEARNPRSIAHGLVRLIQDREYASKIAAAGWEMSQKFTWQSSIDKMERILLGEALK